MDSGIKTAIILGIGIAGAIVGISLGFSSLEETSFEPVAIQDEDGVLQATNIDKSKFKKAPDLVGIANYINTTPQELQEQIKGKVVLYDIWTYSCINCIRTLPYITAWDDKYSDDEFLIIGIHSPEFEFEKDLHNVEMAVEKHGINYPVVLDNDWETWKAFENRYWPRKYIADHEGYIRYDHIGEGAYQETEKIIQELLMERSESLGMQVVSAESLVEIQEFEHTSFRTPELYFGYKFVQGRNQLGSSEGFNPNTEVTYSIPEKLDQHYFYLEGTWLNLEGNMKLVSETGRIKLLYHAKEVNIVAGNDTELEIYLDDEPIPSSYAGDDIVNQNKVITNQPGLYNLIKSDKPSSHVLDIIVDQSGFEVYTFTFG
jgi:thiol-disulfide isomerase/thioredoxin